MTIESAESVFNDERVELCYLIALNKTHNLVWIFIAGSARLQALNVPSTPQEQQLFMQASWCLVKLCGQVC